MKQKLYYILSLFTLLSCSQSDILDSPPEEVKYVSLVIGGTRTSNTQELPENAVEGSHEGTSLPDGLIYGVYVLDEEGTPILNGDNVKVTNGNDGIGKLEHSLLIKEDDKVNLYAYYPYSSQALWSSYENGVISYIENPVIDDVWAVNTDATYSGKELAVLGTDPHAYLLFHHIKSRLVFNFHIDEQSDNEYQDFKYTIKNAYTQCDFNIKNQAFNDEGIAGDIDMSTNENLSNTHSVSSKCLIIPMPSNISWQVMLEVAYSNGDDVKTLSAPILMPEGQGWAAGKSYMYDVTVPAPESQSVELEISNCTIIPWNENILDEITIENENFVDSDANE